ncbi:MAG: peptidoglycan DD-metalloendopeptidase family protein [Balneolales bacterium]|nr:peptidoglycan DD-metalloendopeptidase family protein [Balneolales bacterium]
MKFKPVMEYDSSLPLPKIDLSMGYSHNPDAPQLIGAGGYLEYRRNMYTSALFGGERFIHMGVDIWGEAGTPVFAFADGFFLMEKDNDNNLDYGPTIITVHTIGDTQLYALYGHLSRNSLGRFKEGDSLKAGENLGWLGNRKENGGWIPHLHFQLSLQRPETADMPGVVSPEQLEESLKIYPDPRIVLGPLYL